MYDDFGHHMEDFDMAEVRKLTDAERRSLETCIDLKIASVIRAEKAAREPELVDVYKAHVAMYNALKARLLDL